MKTFSILEDAEFIAMTNDPEGYALATDDESLAPRMRVGDIVLVSPNRAPEPGGDVFVRCHDGRAMLRRLIANSPDGLSLGSINLGDGWIFVPAADVATCHCAVGTLPNGRGAATRDTFQ